MAGIAAEHRAAAGDARPRLDYPPYRGTALRHPQRPPLAVDSEGAERGPRVSASGTSIPPTPT